MFSSFGFFMLLAFIAAYWVFRSEYRRKEEEGLLHPFAMPVRNIPLVVWGLAGGLVGAKLVYWWQHQGMYIGRPQDFVFSTRGSLAGGLVTGLVAMLAVMLQARALRERSTALEHRRSNVLGQWGSLSDGEARLMHPYELMDYLLLCCGLTGFAGAVVFAKFEDPSALGQLSWRWLFAFNGLNYYGALITGALTYLYINKRRGIRPAIAADIGSPGMMLAYAIGRIGCQVAGDGDWGIVNERPLPAWLSWIPDWCWAYRYPHNSVHQGIYIPGCMGNNCTILETPVYPTPVYETFICLCLFVLLWRLRRKIKKTGLLFAYFAILNGTERFFIEFIRVNPRFAAGPWNLSQAQLLSLGWMITGLVALSFSLRRRGFSQ